MTILNMSVIDLDFTKVVTHGDGQVLLEMESPIIAEKATIYLPWVNFPTPGVDSFKL